MAEGFKFYHAWLLRSFRRSAYPDRSREIADGQRSWKYFIDSAAVLVFADHEVLRLGKSSSSGSVLWVSTAKCDRRGTAVKVSQRRLESISYPTFSVRVCVCVVLFQCFPWFFLRNMSLRTKNCFDSCESVSEVSTNAFYLLATHAVWSLIKKKKNGGEILKDNFAQKICINISISAKLENLTYFRNLFGILATVRLCHWLICPVSSWASLVIF